MSLGEDETAFDATLDASAISPRKAVFVWMLCVGDMSLGRIEAIPPRDGPRVEELVLDLVAACQSVRHTKAIGKHSAYQ